MSQNAFGLTTLNAPASEAKQGGGLASTWVRGETEYTPTKSLTRRADEATVDLRR